MYGGVLYMGASYTQKNMVILHSLSWKHEKLYMKIEKGTSEDNNENKSLTSNKSVFKFWL